MNNDYYNDYQKLFGIVYQRFIFIKVIVVDLDIFYIHLIYVTCSKLKKKTNTI